MPQFGMMLYRFSTLSNLFLGIALLISMIGAAGARSSIGNVLIISETTDSVILEIYYSYDGRQGDRAFASARMTKGGTALNDYGYKPGQVSRGRGRTRVKLGTNAGAPALFDSDGLEIQLYQGRGGAFATKTVAFSKTWAKPRAALRPAGKTLVLVQPNRSAMMAPPGNIQPGAGSGGAKVERRIRPDGKVELRYPDGRVELLYAGGKTIIMPDGQQQRLAYSSAQPPTPPSAPPNSEHALWLEAEAAGLLNIIEALVAFDKPSIQAYLQSEGGLSPYAQISNRTRVIGRLVQQ